MPDPERAQWTTEHRRRVDELVDEYRAALHDALNEFTEEDARRRLVPSKTTLLGLVEHATFVEGGWFDQAITGRSYADIGIATTVDGSFTSARPTPSRPCKRPTAPGGSRHGRTSFHWRATTS